MNRSFTASAYEIKEEISNTLLIKICLSLILIAFSYYSLSRTNNKLFREPGIRKSKTRLLSNFKVNPNMFYEIFYVL